MTPRRCLRVRCSEQRAGNCRTWDRCDWFIPATEQSRPPTPAVRSCPTEEEEQKALFAECTQCGLQMIHIPNEAKRTARVGASLKAQGMRTGFPDNFFPYARQGYHGLFIELKRAMKSASRVSPEQREWIDRLRAEGYRAEICYGAKDAMTVVNEYMTEKQGEQQ